MSLVLGLFTYIVIQIVAGKLSGGSDLAFVAITNSFLCAIIMGCSNWIVCAIREGHTKENGRDKDI